MIPDLPSDGALDRGPGKAGPGSARLCIATGEVRPISEMVRFVLGPDGNLVPDLKRRLAARAPTAKVPA